MKDLKNDFKELHVIEEKETLWYQGILHQELACIIRMIATKG